MKEEEISPSRVPRDAVQEGKAHHTLHILVVEDEQIVRRLLRFVLANAGYEVETAENGAVAWESLQAKHYDLLVTDQNMPKVTGVELIKNVRSAQMDLPVIMVAGTLPEEELEKDPSLHVAATLLKPFILTELLTAVAKVLQAAEHHVNHPPNWQN